MSGAHFRAAFSVLFLILHVLVVVLLGMYGRFETTAAADRVSPNILGLPQVPNERYQSSYKAIIDVTLFLLGGYGFHFAFLRKNGFSSVGFSFFISSFAIEYGILVMNFFRRAHCAYLQALAENCPPTGFNPGETKFEISNREQGCNCIGFDSRPLILTLSDVLEGQYAAASVLVSLGALLGQVGPLQLLILSTLQITVYGVNYFITILLLGGVDNSGGGTIVHVFGAYFGLGASVALSGRNSFANPDNSSRYNSDLIALLGTIMFFTKFPTFNAIFTPNLTETRVIINTILALLSSCISAFAFSCLFRPERKFNMKDIHHATITGGVSIASCSGYLISPAAAMATGAVSACISVLGFCFLQPTLNKFNLQDTCGVNHTHGIPGLISGLASIASTSIFAGQTLNIEGELIPYSSLFPSEEYQSAAQAKMVAITFFLALASGLIFGVVTKPLGGPPVNMTYNDRENWQVPDDFDKSEQTNLELEKIAP